MVQICDILIWIRSGAAPLTNVSDLQDANKNNSFSFFSSVLLKVHLHHSSQTKVIKKSRNTERNVFLTIYARWWKDPDPYLWLTDPGDPKTYGTRTYYKLNSVEDQRRFHIFLQDASKYKSKSKLFWKCWTRILIKAVRIRTLHIIPVTS